MQLLPRTSSLGWAFSDLGEKMRELTTQRRKAGLQAPWSPEPISLAQLTMASVGNREKLSSWGLGFARQP